MAAANPTRLSEAGAGGVPSPFERFWTPRELAELWRLSEQSIRRLFQDEPGVLTFGSGGRRGCRTYVTIRIPGAIVERVFRARAKK